MKKRLLEIILFTIVALLIITLIWLQLAAIPYKVMQDYEYDYPAYKSIVTENSITVTTYSTDGDTPKWVSIYYLENGKIVKIVEELHFRTINDAKFSHKQQLPNYIENNNEGQTFEIEKNVIIRTINNPEIYYEEELQFSSNEELIEYYNANLDENFPGLTRVY